MYIFLVLLISFLVFIDQITKKIMYDISMGNIGYSIPVLGDFLRFTYVENHGGIFGLFQGNIKAFTVISSVLIIYIILTEWKNFVKTSFINKIGISFIVAGASGNMIDRFLRGFVIDMIDFRGIWSFIFNVADMYIHIGIYILIIAYILDRKKKIKMKLKPFTKWIGGKRQLLDILIEQLPNNYNKYYEAFVGAGALFFELAPKNAIINDLNTELILTYKTIKNNINDLINELKIHEENDSKDYYLKIRNLDRNLDFFELSEAKRAARFIYLLRVNFNGIYRVNSKNQFNVPYGDGTKKKIFDEELLLNINKYFNENNINIYNKDFEDIFEKVKKGDFVYFDPPYIPLNVTSSFTSYTKNGFDMEDQIRLKNLIDKLTKKGVYVVLSNSYTNITKELYKEYNQIEVYAKRAVNSISTKRGKVKELIIKNY